MDEEGLEWRMLSSISFRTGTLYHMIGYRDGEVVCSQVFWSDDEPPPGIGARPVMKEAA